MDVLFLLNEATRLTWRQTTARLVLAAMRQGARVHVGGVAQLTLEADDRISIHAVPAPKRIPADTTALVRSIGRTKARRLYLDQVGLVLMRTNPARDDRAWAHHAALQLLRRASHSGPVVVNAPDGLIAAATKLFLAEIPRRYRPPTLVSADPVALLAFFDDLDGPGVIKPVSGSRGDSVFLVRPDDHANRHQIVEAVASRGFAMAQGFVPGADQGDVRILVLDGQPLVIDGRVAAVRRVPGPRDFRSNIHAGGQAVPAELTDNQLQLVADVGPILVRAGLFFVGLDVIGTHVVEVNAYAPGGLHDAEAFSGMDFSGAVMESFMQRGEARRRG